MCAHMAAERANLGHMAGDMTAGRTNLGHMAGDMAGAHGVLGHMAGVMAVEDDVLGHMGIMRELVSFIVRVVYKKQQRASITALHKFRPQRVALQQAVSVVAKGVHSKASQVV